MKIKALGVNSAFAVGDYVNAVSLETVETLLEKIESSDSSFTKESFLKDLEKNSESLYKPKWQSNFLLEFDQGNGETYRLVLDFGNDIRHSLKGAGLTFSDIHGYYCSHPHADHIGGIEGIALTHIFNPYFREGKADWLKNPKTGDQDIIAMRLADGFEIPNDYKPDLYCHEYVLDALWTAAKPGLQTIQGVPDLGLQTYFNVIPMYDNIPVMFKDADRIWKIYTVTSVHVNTGYCQMPSFGLMFEADNGKIIFMPTDTQFMSPRQVKLYYDRAQVIFLDCETGPRSDVHPHIDDIRSLPAEVKSKCLLYHFGNEPEINENEFLGVLKVGDLYEF